MISLHNASLTILSITIILVASMVLVAMPEFSNPGIAQGQGNNMTSPSLTPNTTTGAEAPQSGTG